MAKVEKRVPWALKKCAFGSSHWPWERVGACAYGTVINEDGEHGWHGGILDMDADCELIPCAKCYPEYSQATHQWSLSGEEESILQCWREFRQGVLDGYGDTSYKYKITVSLNNGDDIALMTRTVGLPPLDGGARGSLADTARLKKSSKPN